MKVLIATKVLRRIEAEIVLTVGYGGYRVMIREVETISQVFNKAPHLSLCISKDDQLSDNVVPGFEDIDDNISHHEVEGGEQGSVPVQNYSNGTKVKETTSSNGSSQHAASKTRTPIVSFSQNGYSEELLKVKQHLSKVANTKEFEESPKEKDSQPPQDLNLNLNVTITCRTILQQGGPFPTVMLNNKGLMKECVGNQRNTFCRTGIEQVCTD